MKSSNKKGFTLIEVIISIMLLGIISISILPMAAYSVKYTKWNNIKLNALNLAYTQVEWIKSLEYKKIGLDNIGYLPNGEVNQTKYMNKDEDVVIKGIKYKLTTNIYWQKETSTTGEPVPHAIKKVDVTVEAMDLNSEKQKEYAVLGTLITKEGERDPSKPGYIIINTYMRSLNLPEKDVKVGMGTNNNYSNFSFTDEKGEALLGNLFEGDYFIEPVKWKNKDIVVMPNGVEGSIGSQNWKTNRKVTVPKWDKNNIVKYPEESFLIDSPGYINITDRNSNIDILKIEIKPTGESYIPTDGENSEHMTLTTTIKNIKDIKFWRMWNYEYIIKNNNDRYYLVDTDNTELWDGKFNIPDLMDDSIEKLNLAFGIEEANYEFNNGNTSKIGKILIVFTSGIKNVDIIKFSINNEEIASESYIITGTNSNKTITIIFNEGLDILEEELNFEILNHNEITNNYNMTLSKEFSDMELKLK